MRRAITRRSLGSVVFGSLAILVPLAFGGCEPAEMQSLAARHDPLTALGGTAASSLSCGGSTSVNVGISGTNVTESTPTDIMLVVDESGSINASAFAQLKTFMRTLVQDLADLFTHGGKIGVVMFSGQGVQQGVSRLISGLSDDPAALDTAIQGIVQAHGSTCIGCGIERAHDEVAAGSSADRNRIMLVLTDGINTSKPPGTDPATTPAQHLDDTLAAAKSDGIEFFAVGVGTNNLIQQLDNIASEPDSEHRFLASGFAQLQALLATVVAAVVRPEATGALLELSVSNAFSPAGESVDAGTVSRVGNQLSWTIGDLLDTTVALTYGITHDPASGGGQLAVHSAVTYSDAEGNAFSLDPIVVDVFGCDGDNDGVVDEDDACPDSQGTANAAGCPIAQVCPCDAQWGSHGDYVSCVAQAASDFKKAGLISGAEKGATTAAAAKSDCGK